MSDDPIPSVSQPTVQDARRAIVGEGYATASLLESRLGVRYARAAELIDELEERGYIDPFDGQHGRRVRAPFDEEVVPDVVVFRCAACEDHGRPRDLVAFPIKTEVGAVSEHWCGAKMEWTGEPPGYMKALADPDDWKGYLIIATLVVPSVAGLLVAGATGAIVGLGAAMIFLFAIRSMRDAFDGRFTWWIGWWW